MEPLRELSRNHVLGNPIRLGIMLYLLPRERVLFKELLEVLEVTPGNLDSHLRAPWKKRATSSSTRFSPTGREPRCE
jgi:predicted transcriptional regulator